MRASVYERVCPRARERTCVRLSPERTSGVWESKRCLTCERARGVWACWAREQEVCEKARGVRESERCVREQEVCERARSVRECKRWERASVWTCWASARVRAEEPSGERLGEGEGEFRSEAALQRG